jgi:hypothetical protein
MYTHILRTPSFRSSVRFPPPSSALYRGTFYIEKIYGIDVYRRSPRHIQFHE